MQAREQELLDNLLDALDQLFDGECDALDVWALIVATGEEMRDTPHKPALDQPLVELQTVIQSRTAADEQRDLSLVITDPLRKYLARVLPWPSDIPDDAPDASST